MTPASAHTSPASTPCLRGLEVISVEDCPDWASLTGRALEPLGTGFRHFSCVEDALIHLRSDGRRALLVDLHLGERNGDELIEYLMREKPETPFVILSGTLSLEAAGRLRDMGFPVIEKDSVVHKPAEFRTALASLVSSWPAGRPALERLRFLSEAKSCLEQVGTYPFVADEIRGAAFRFLEVVRESKLEAGLQREIERVVQPEGLYQTVAGKGGPEYKRMHEYNSRMRGLIYRLALEQKLDMRVLKAACRMIGEDPYQLIEACALSQSLGGEKLGTLLASELERARKLYPEIQIVEAPLQNDLELLKYLDSPSPKPEVQVMIRKCLLFSLEELSAGEAGGRLQVEASRYFILGSMGEHLGLRIACLGGFCRGARGIFWYQSPDEIAEQVQLSDGAKKLLADLSSNSCRYERDVFFMSGDDGSTRLELCITLEKKEGAASRRPPARSQKALPETICWYDYAEMFSFYFAELLMVQMEKGQPLPRHIESGSFGFEDVSSLIPRDCGLLVLHLDQSAVCLLEDQKEKLPKVPVVLLSNGWGGSIDEAIALFPGAKIIEPRCGTDAKGLIAEILEYAWQQKGKS